MKGGIHLKVSKRNNKKRKLSFLLKLQKAIIIISKILIEVNKEKRKKRKNFLKKCIKTIKLFFSCLNEYFDEYIDYLVEKICPEPLDETKVIDLTEYFLEQQEINERREMFR